MTEEEIRQALLEASGGHAYVDAGDEGTFILDGAFTLRQLVAIGEVARKALGEEVSPLTPQPGARIRILYGHAYARIGERGELVRQDDDGDWWFRNSLGEHVCISADQFEVVQ